MAKKNNRKVSYILPNKKTNKTKSRTSRSKKGSKKFSNIQKIIISVIIGAIVVVIVAVVASLALTPERMAKSKIEDLAKDYYENFFYNNLVATKSSADEVKQTVSNYKDTGLTTITLRQLILHDSQKNREVGDYLEKYCNENNTFIKFYPVEPYDKTSYHIEYTYSCDF